jgi:hypothetical protein
MHYYFIPAGATDNNRSPGDGSSKADVSSVCKTVLRYKHLASLNQRASFRYSYIWLPIPIRFRIILDSRSSDYFP